jgi:transcriptional regulator of NAD metabolism
VNSSSVDIGNAVQVYQIIEYLGRNHNITCEGLFRKHGNLKKQQALKERLNKVGVYFFIRVEYPVSGSLQVDTNIPSRSSVVDTKLFVSDPNAALEIIPYPACFLNI